MLEHFYFVAEDAILYEIIALFGFLPANEYFTTGHVLSRGILPSLLGEHRRIETPLSLQFGYLFLQVSFYTLIQTTLLLEEGVEGVLSVGVTQPALHFVSQNAVLVQDELHLLILPPLAILFWHSPLLTELFYLFGQFLILAYLGQFISHFGMWL